MNIFETTYLIFIVRLLIHFFCVVCVVLSLVYLVFVIKKRLHKHDLEKEEQEAIKEILEGRMK